MKIISFLLISVGVFVSVCSHSQSIKADSLFQEKKYMEALTQYDSVFNAGFYTESMLLKMAYINEGLGRNEDAIYYLKFLNRENPSLELQSKIEELAVENEQLKQKNQEILSMNSTLSQQIVQLQGK